MTSRIIGKPNIMNNPLSLEVYSEFVRATMETSLFFYTCIHVMWFVKERKEGRKSSIGVCGMFAEQNLFLDKYRFLKNLPNLPKLGKVTSLPSQRIMSMKL